MTMPVKHYSFLRNTPSHTKLQKGRVAEWLMAPVLKTGVPERVSGVRIPPLPPFTCSRTSEDIQITSPNPIKYWGLKFIVVQRLPMEASAWRGQAWGIFEREVDGCDGVDRHGDQKG